MKQIIFIAFLFMSFCVEAQSNTTRISDLEKFRTWAKTQFSWFAKEHTKDSLEIIKLKSTSNQTTLSRVAIVEDKVLTLGETMHTIDSLVSWKMAQVQTQDWTTMRKDVGFIVKENERLTSEVTLLRDSLNKFKPTVFPDHDVIIGAKADTVRNKRIIP